MMKIIIALARAIFKLLPLDFVQKYIYTILTIWVWWIDDKDDDDDDDSDDEDDYIFEGRSQKHPEGKVLKKMGGHPLSPKMGGV